MLSLSSATPTVRFCCQVPVRVLQCVVPMAWSDVVDLEPLRYPCMSLDVVQPM
jgi:hypothetical protein